MDGQTTINAVRMRREIGSEFWTIPRSKQCVDLFPRNTLWFLSGRTALTQIIRDIQNHRPFRSVAMPSWCCDSMIEPFLRQGIEVCFYPVYPDGHGRLVQDLSGVIGCDGLLRMDYFGYTQLVETLGFEGVVIRDTTHSLFAGVPDDADYVFGSLRKWAGFQTGGYGWKQTGGSWGAALGEADVSYITLRQQAMEEKQQYIAGQREDKGYLNLFAQAEELLDQETELYAAHPEDVAAAQKLDVEYLRQRRRENASILLETVGDWALFPELQTEDCPLFVPILVPNGKRDALRRFLIEREIYCPIHWPISVLHRLDAKERGIYDAELSLICDQRYDSADMLRICDALKEFFDRR